MKSLEETGSDLCVQIAFLYKEIFLDGVYTRNGVTIGAGDVVIDVGANIGLFTLQAAELCGPSVRFDPQQKSYTIKP